MYFNFGCYCYSINGNIYIPLSQRFLVLVNDRDLTEKGEINEDPDTNVDTNNNEKIKRMINSLH